MNTDQPSARRCLVPVLNQEVRLGVWTLVSRSLQVSIGGDVHRRVLRRGERAFTIGESGPAWLIESGSIEATDNDGFLALLEEGSIAGSSGLVGKPYQSSGTAAMDDTRLIALDTDALVKRVGDDPLEGERIIRRLLDLLWNYIDNKRS